MRLLRIFSAGVLACCLAGSAWAQVDPSNGMLPSGDNATSAALANVIASASSAAQAPTGQWTFIAPILGTPASGVATNLTGTAAGLTAGTVTTNANMTGPITSIGNATSIASQTGTGTKFVVDTSPTLVTPVIGAATGTSLGLTGSLAVTTGGGNSTLTWGTNSNAILTFVNNGANLAQFDSTFGLKLTDGSLLGFTSSNTVGASADVSLSREGAGIIDIGNGGGNTSGSLKMTNLSASGTITFAGVTTGTNADFACFAAGGVMTLQATACSISSIRFKNLLNGTPPLRALDTVAKLDPIVFTMKEGEQPNADWNYDKPQIGLSAENVAAIEPRCAIYEQDGVTPKSYRQECLIAVLVAGMQEQRREIAALKSHTKHD